MSVLVPTENDPSYLKQRLEELGITDEQNTFVREWKNSVDEKGADGKITTKVTDNTREYKILDSDPEGNIVIHYFNLNGQPYRWTKEDTKFSRDYVRKRLKEVKENGQKYFQEAGSPQFPFFPKAIIEKYQKSCAWLLNTSKEDQLTKENPGQIHTLYLVEGEIKSFKASFCGIDIIGLPSIHGFYNGDVKGRLHEDIEELLVKCQVQNVVFLVDADLLTLKWAEGKDLAKRPISFYGSIKAFRESLQNLIDAGVIKTVYFMHQKIRFLKDAKGLDDLLVKYTAKTVEIINDMACLASARVYFDCMFITDLSKDIQGKVYKLLGLTDESEFYKTYSDFIQLKEFRFKRRRYIYDAEKKEVVFVKHEDAEKFMRIGPDWVKVISKLNKHGELEEELVSWKIGEIERDYKKKFPDFVETIVRYDDFCNEPAWDATYQQSIQGCYNVCRPLKWNPKQGSIDNTIGFLKHLFGGKGNVFLDSENKFEKEEAITGDQFTVALDYLTLLFTKPKQMLPVPCLVSPENETGKSTFLKWLQMLFGVNACILGNAQFQMKFNGHYISKYIIGIDESFLEVDKKAEKERLKQLVTADSAFLENKGMNVRKINYYGKVILVSNDADRIMKIEEGETRWFVVRVPRIPRVRLDGQKLLDKGYKSLKGETIDPAKTYEVANIDPDLEIKMKKEADAFLHFIFNRKVFHPRVSRLWFDPEWIITDQYKIIVETTKNRVDRVFENWIQDQFLLFKLPILRFTQTYLSEVFNDPKTSKYKIDEIEMKAYLERRGLKIEVPQRHKIPTGFDLLDGLQGSAQEPRIIFSEKMGRPYKFIAEDWLTAAQLEEFKKPGNATVVTPPAEKEKMPVQASLELTRPLEDRNGKTNDNPF
jgi:hypothetical protein